MMNVLVIFEVHCIKHMENMLEGTHSKSNCYRFIEVSIYFLFPARYCEDTFHTIMIIRYNKTSVVSKTH